jgi:hypothetical protein
VSGWGGAFFNLPVGGPQGLKPGLFQDDLRGAKAPLFHVAREHRSSTLRASTALLCRAKARLFYVVRRALLFHVARSASLPCRPEAPSSALR